MSFFHGAILRALPFVPRPLVRRIAGRYIAGETLDDLIRTAGELDRQGLLSTVDVLGENVASAEEARAGTDEYLRAVDRLTAARLPADVSVKLTLLGLRVSEDMARSHLEEIVAAAEARSLSVTIDMEDSTTTDATLRIFRALRERHERVAVAIQAYLRRSAADVASLLALRPAIRICKGIYHEPAEIALREKGEIRQSFIRLVRDLVEGGGYPAIATHDPWLVDRAIALLDERPAGHEFQMLLGVGEGLRRRILARGSRLRIYCPYGPDWYAYSVRRLRENPKMAAFALRSLFSRRVLLPGWSGPGASGRRR
jgi:proline dehydrogenase